MGMKAVGIVTESFSVVERNTKLPPFEGILVWNRILWLSAGALLMLITYSRFKFSQTVIKAKKDKKQRSGLPARFEIPAVKRDFSFKQNLLQCFKLIKLEFTEIIGSANFIAIVFAGIILLVVSVFQSGKLYETQTLPVTYQVLEVLNGNFMIISFIILLIYAGETLWKAREHKLDGIFDSQPLPDWVTMFSKFLALLLVQLCLIIMATAVGIIYQYAKHFDQIELGLYAANIGLQMIYIFLLTSLIFFIHTLANKKFAGHALAIGVFVGLQFISFLGLEHPLFKYAGGADWVYSDMNGFGNTLDKWTAFMSYWGLLAMIMLVVSLLFYPRGKETALRQRWHIAQQRFSLSHKYLILVLLLGFIGMGSYIYYNENTIGNFKRSSTIEKERAQFEKKYRHYNGISQPRYTDIYVEADIFPADNRAQIYGVLKAENKTGQNIDSLIIFLNPDIDYEYFNVSLQYRANLADTDLGIYSYIFTQPLMPGEKLEIEFNCRLEQKGYHPFTAVVQNGTFFNSMMFFPHLGYTDSFELLSEEKRRKYDLPEKLRMARVDDEKARMNNYISSDADWVNYEAVVSTAPNQTAITPGYLLETWQQNGRNYFHYKMDHPVLNFFCYVSAEYEKKLDVWKNSAGEEVELTVYYNHKHPYNIDRMLKALKSGLDYYTTNFGSYPDRQVRILEFPRYSAYAQSFANTIPYSESVGFVADVQDRQDNIDYPFFITAHELAHQWWAHQVIGANVQGCVLMSEALAQYSALMVMEKEYGKHQIGKFLRHELNSYLMGRGNESREETPLYLVENQQYIHYNKGAITMYALRDFCGEKAVNSALKKYLNATAYQQPPYTNSLEFMQYIQEVVPDSISYIIDDWFKNITLYNNKMTSAVCTKESERRYVIDLEFQTDKFYADGLGKETPAPMNDLVEIVIFGNAYINGVQVEKPVYSKKIRLSSGKHNLSVVTKRMPTKAGIDGMHKLIDKFLWDNVINVEFKEE
jgi:hypothetical protein